MSPELAREDIVSRSKGSLTRFLYFIGNLKNWNGSSGKLMKKMSIKEK